MKWQKLTEGKRTLLLTLGPTSPLSPLTPVGPGGPCFDRKSRYRKMNMYSFKKFWAKQQIAGLSAKSKSNL